MGKKPLLQAALQKPQKKFRAQRRFHISEEDVNITEGFLSQLQEREMRDGGPGESGGGGRDNQSKCPTPARLHHRYTGCALIYNSLHLVVRSPTHHLSISCSQGGSRTFCGTRKHFKLLEHKQHILFLILLFVKPTAKYNIKKCSADLF